MADLFGTYDKRIKLTIDHTKIDADLSWFPITVFLGNYGDAIDVGAAATNRGAAESAGFTIIAKNNPANSSGTITSVEIYAETNMDGVIVATFSADGNNITARDSYSIGSVTAGSKQTFEVELSVETGDYLGFYNSSGGISSDGTGGDGRWYKSGDYTDCVDEAFTSGAGTIYSIYATGFEKSQGTEVFTEFDADEDFDRIAFTSSDGETQLYADCELFDVSENKAIYHVSKTGWTVSSSTDTDIYLYYDNTADHNTTYISKSGGTAAQSVWDSSFKAVYHMADNTTSTIVDSTSNNNDGTKKAANEPIEATGKVGQGQDFDGSDDYIEIPDFSLFDGLNDFTVEAIVNTDSVPASDDWKNAPVILSFRGEREYLITYDDSASNPDRLSSRANLSVSGYTTLVESTRQSIDTDYFHATTFDTTNGWVWYENGSSQDTNANTESFVSSSNANYIGWLDGGTGQQRHFNGLIDEVRISSTNRSAAWISATYDSLWDTLLTYGAEETSGEQKEGTCSIGIETQFNSVLSKGNIQQATLSIEISTDFTTALSKGKTENANSTIGIQTNFQSILSFGKTSEATITISGITDFSGVLSSGIVANATSSINLSALFVGNITYGIVQNAISTINSATLFVGALSKGVTGQATITIGITTLFDSILIGGKRKQAISNIGILALFESILDYGILQQAQTTIGINTQFDSLLNKGKTGNATIGIKIDSLFNSVLSKGKTENAITNIGIQTLFETELGRYKKAVSNINIATLFDTELSKGMIEQTSSKINILTLIESSLSKGIFQEATISVNTSTQFNSVLSNGIIVNGNSSIGISTDFSSVLEKGIIENASGTLNLDTLFSVDLNVIKKYSVSATIGITTSIESALSKGIIEDAVAVNSLNTQFNAELGVAGIKFATSNINILTSFNSTLKRGKTENCISSITLDTQFNAVLDSGKIEQAILDIGLNTDFVGIINNGITEQANATVNLNTDFDADITHYKLVQANEIIEIRTDFVSELSYGKLEQAISRINIATDYESLLKIYGEIRNGNASILIYTLFESDLSQQYKHSQAILGISSNQSKFEIQKIDGDFEIQKANGEYNIIE